MCFPEHGDFGGNNPRPDAVREIFEPLLGGSLFRGVTGTLAIYYNPDTVEPVGDIQNDIQGNTKSTGLNYQKFKHKSSGREFGFFCSHRGNANSWGFDTMAIKQITERSGGVPSVFMGDFNTWEWGMKEWVNNIKRDLNMEDAVGDGDTWCAGGKVDYILFEKSKWVKQGGRTNLDHCGTDYGGHGSSGKCDQGCHKRADHGSLEAELLLGYTLQQS